MRVLIVAAFAALAACASTGAPNLSGDTPNPFPVERGSALPPPELSQSAQPAPPEGEGPGGFDFGQWRGADPASYAPAFQERVRARYADQEISYIRADLERNGFACEQSGRLECRIEIMERQCAVDWYVVVERAGAQPIAGHDVMCLGAR
jgi:hypothetical protein